MTQLKCDVVHCVSNRDGCCCRQGIQIGGEHATNQQQTCCESFQCAHTGTTNSTMGSVTSSCGCKQGKVNPTMPIHCMATNCMYNKNHECDAKSVQVSGQSAEQTDQTSCATFSCTNGCQK